MRLQPKPVIKTYIGSHPAPPPQEEGAAVREGWLPVCASCFQRGALRV